MAIDHETRDRELYQMMINEGFLREHIAELIATGNHERLDELHARMIADVERRKRDVPINLSEGVVDVTEAKMRARNRRLDQEIAIEEAHFDNVAEQLANIMERSGLSDHSLILATLRALVDMLMFQDSEITIEQVKEMITQNLNVKCALMAHNRAPTNGE